jgi:fatty acid desaturase
MAANIGARERRKRLAIGIAAFGASLALAAGLFATDQPRWWRLVLFVPLWGAALGVFQARDKT